LKPFSFDRFRKGVAKAVDFIRSKNEDDERLLPGIFVKSEYKLVKINFRDIVYVESMDDYIRIHLAEGRPVITLMTLKSFMESLPPTGFLRVHRRYIVAAGRVSSIGSKKLLLQNGTAIPVGNTYYETVRAFRNRH
ncbi:MAG TPA: LytTR family DNA-binding domain-containing protein, partial [Agriterribacter sp.]|nr:LytTR family DNA-binding domain-containing protein [Agriterribacter sp.]